MSTLSLQTKRKRKPLPARSRRKLLRVIAKKCSIAIVKVGAKGSYIRKGTEEIKVSAISVQKVVDTTGAGDYFASGFLIRIDLRIFVG